MTQILVANLAAFVLLLIGYATLSLARRADRHMGVACGLLPVPPIMRPISLRDDDILARTIRRKGVAADAWRMFSLFFIAAGGLIIGRFL